MIDSDRDANRSRDMVALRYQELVEHGPAIIYIARADALTSTIYVSPQIETVLGFTPDEFITNPALWRDRLHPDDLPRFENDVTEGIGHDVRTVVEYRFIARDGRTVWIQDEITYVRDEHGEKQLIRGVMLDITERKQVEEDLRLRERALEAASNGIVMTDPGQPDNPIVYVNPAFEKITGYSRTEAIGKNCRFLQGPESSQAVRQALRDAMVADEPVRVTIVNYRKDGEPFWNDLSISPVVNDAGQIIRYIGILDDVTERVHAVESMQRSEERFRALIQNSSDVITILDHDGIVTYESPAIERVLGYSAAESIGVRAFTASHPDDRDRGNAFFQNVLRQPGRTLTTEVRFLHANGEWRVLQLHATNLLDRPDVQGIVVNSRDVTERHRADEALRRSAAIVETSQDAIMSTDPDGSIRTWNPSAERIYGYSASEVVGKPVKTLFAEGRLEEARAIRDRLLRGERVERHETVRQRKDGSLVDISMSSAPIVDESGAVVALATIARDISEQKRTEQALREAEERYRLLVEHIPSVTYIQASDDKASTLYMSPRIESLVGYAPSEWLADPGLWEKVMHPDDRATVITEHLRTNVTGDPFVMEYRMVARDGRIVWVRDEAHLLRDAEGRALYWQGNFIDITESKHAELALRRSAERFRSLIQNATDLITLTDASGTILYESPAVTEMLGLSPDETVGTYIFAELHHDDLTHAVEYLRSAVAAPGQHDATELRFMHADGSWRYIETRVTNLLDDPAVAAIVFNSHDVTERRKFEEQLQLQAFYDRLTGLPNRSLLLDRIEHALARTKRNDRRVAIAFLDLDRFKVVNDSLGHAAGDRLLVHVAQRLLGVVRTEDTVARLGGDEFVVLIEDVDDLSDVTTIASRVIDAFEAPVVIGDHEAFVTTSIGIALSGDHGGALDSGELLRNADVALYRAKGEGRGRYVIFDPSMNVFSAERLSLESDLQRAVERGELRLAFQPEVDLRTGRITTLEALARWEHPKRGVISPGEFIPIAEETGLIVGIGQWVLGEACRQARAWQHRKLTPEPLTIAVNLSARQFQQVGLVEQLEIVLAETDMNPELLRLEITESVLVQEAGAARETLQRIKELGVQIAIDDFGIGYSSLAYLTRLLADTLKVDRSFVTAIGRDEQSFAIVAAVASLAHALGMTVTAEGIETARQLDLVRASGCDDGQGYYFSKPVSATTVEELLASSGQRADWSRAWQQD